jgi:hypothetical protein
VAAIVPLIGLGPRLRVRLRLRLRPRLRPRVLAAAIALLIDAGIGLQRRETEINKKRDRGIGEERKTHERVRQTETQNNCAATAK